jgi:hypothetical protein
VGCDDSDCVCAEVLKNNGEVVKCEWDRRANGIPQEKLDGMHEALSRIAVKVVNSPSLSDVREILGEIRISRNKVARVLAATLPRMARIRAEALRLDRVIELHMSAVLGTGEGGIKVAKNDRARTALAKVLVSGLLDVRADMHADLVGLDELIAHAKLVRDELRSAFEEVSRALAAIELEYRIERSAP